MQFDNYSLGNATSLQRVYELLRHKDKLEQYDLIIIESFLNDINDACYWYEIENIHRDIYFLYNELAKLNTKVLNIFIAMGLFNENNLEHQLIYNIHKYYANYFSICTLDMHNYVLENKLLDFIKKPVAQHPLDTIMYKIGERIIENIKYISKPNCDFRKVEDFGLSFISCVDFNNDISRKNIKNSMYNENALVFDKNSSALDISQFTNKVLIGMHCWNNDGRNFAWNDALKHFSCIKLKNKNIEIVRSMCYKNAFLCIQSNFVIDNETTINYEQGNQVTEQHFVGMSVTKQDSIRLDHFNLIGLLFCEKNILMKKDDIKIKFSNKFTLDKNLNFILPDIVFAKRVLDEYIERVVSLENNQIEQIKQEALNQQKLKQILADLSTFRLDFRLDNNLSNFNFTTKNKLNINYPQWFKSNKGQGCVLTNNNTNEYYFNFYFTSPIDSKINLYFRGIDKRKKDGARLAFWINYKNVTINDVSFGDFSTWHDKAKIIKFPCKKDEKISVSFSIDTYKYSNDELREILKEFYEIEDEIVLKLIYAYVNTKY